MSLSKEASEFCRFCSVKNAIYRCPKCSVKYCSSECYRNKEHMQCSEQFYRDWVVSSLRNKNTTEASKRHIIDILKRSVEIDSDDDNAEGDDYNTESKAASLDERLAAIDFSKDFNEQIVWEKLTAEERGNFESLLKEQKFEDLVPLKKPWWAASEVNLVEEIVVDNGASQNDIVAERPAFPVGLKDLSMLTSATVADCVQYSVVSILYCYVCIMRLYNFDVKDFIEDVFDDILYLAPVLSEKKNYLTLDELVQDLMRLLVSPRFNFPVKFTEFLAQDVCSIIKGPNNVQPNYYTLCALSDLQTLISDFYQCIKSSSISKELKKGKKKLALFASRKINFLMSWTRENDQRLKDISSELQLLLLSDAVQDIHLERLSL